MQIRKYLTYLTDFLFPPSETELQLRGITVLDVFENLPKAGNTEFPFIYSIFSYQNPIVKELVWQIKYKRNNHALNLAGCALFTKLSEEIEGNITLVPVPISSARRRERGYNQSELLIDEILILAREQGRGDKFTADFNLIKRRKDIEKQTFKNKSERFKNTKDIFEITGVTGTQETIVIIDDVSTTGSTINEIRNLLLGAGYRDMIGYTLAH